MSRDSGTIVIGAGHNGLATAALLARAGRRVTVLEAGERIGGLAASEEFYPGYRTDGILHDTSGVRPSVIRELDLERYGLRLEPTPAGVLGLGRDGESVFVSGDPVEAAREIGKISSRDAERYADYMQFLDRVRPLLRETLDAAPVDLVRLEGIGLWEMARRAFGFRKLGKKGMMELLRLPPMALGDWLGEWFESALLKATLAVPALGGTFAGPRSPGTTANLLRREGLRGPGVVAGVGVLISALEAAARAAGVEIRTGSRVTAILTEKNTVRGVKLDGGDTLEGRTVAASCDPKQTLLRLLEPGAVPPTAALRIQALRTRGTTAVVNLALNRPVRFDRRPDMEVEHAVVAADLDAIERAFDAIKYRRVSAEPVLEVRVPSLTREDLAPAGHAVVTALVHFVPHVTEPAWDEAQRQRLGDTVTSILSRHVSGFADSVVGRSVLGPADLEARLGLSGGQIHHGEHALDQMLIRPTPECVGYATPVEGLFLCGSGSHPGGGLTCGPARLASRAILGGKA